MVRDAALCKAASDLLLRRHAIYIQPINYPTVEIGTERLRITPTPRHTEAHVAELVEALVDVWRSLGPALQRGRDRAAAPRRADGGRALHLSGVEAGGGVEPTADRLAEQRNNEEYTMKSWSRKHI